MTERCRPFSAVVLALTLVSGAAAQDVRGAREAYSRALALEAGGNDAAALALLWQAAGAAPRDAEVQNRLGEALAKMGALDAAVEAFEQARSARPGFTKATNNLMLTLVQAGRGEEALRQARRLVAEAPDDPDRLFALGLALSDQDVEEAIRTFRRILDRAPSHTRARYNLALVLQRADRLAEAAKELQRTIDTEPRAEAYYSLGVVRWHQGDLEQATAALQAAIAAEPGYARAPRGAWRRARDRRDWAGAAAALRRAIAPAARHARRPTSHSPACFSRQAIRMARGARLRTASGCAVEVRPSTRRWSGPRSAPPNLTAGTRRRARRLPARDCRMTRPMLLPTIRWVGRSICSASPTPRARRSREPSSSIPVSSRPLSTADQSPPLPELVPQQ